MNAKAENQPTQSARVVSFLVLVGIIVVIAVVFYRVVANFLVPLFLAALLVVIFRPVHNWVLEKCRGRGYLAAGLTTAAILVIVLVPGVLVITLGVMEGVTLVRQFDPQTFTGNLDTLRGRFGLEMPFADQIHAVEAEFRSVSDDTQGGVEPGDLAELETRLEQLQTDAADAGYENAVTRLEAAREAAARAQQPDQSARQTAASLLAAERSFRQFKTVLLGGAHRAWLTEFANPSPEQLQRMGENALTAAQPRLVSFGGKTTGIVLEFVIGLLIMTVALFFFLADGPGMIKSIMQLSPLDDRYEQELFEEFNRISRAVMVATLASAVVQGLLAGIGFWCAGLHSVFLLIMLTTVLAMVPFVGASAVWIPASLWLVFIEERTVAGVLLAIYGAGIVSMADNVIKPYVLHGQSNIHPLLALISVLGGVQALGPIGILVGPMIVAFLQALLKILRRELSQLEFRRGAGNGDGEVGDGQSGE